MLDHVTFNVRDLEVSKAFYAAALAPLGYAVSFESVDAVGFCDERICDFFLYQRGELSAPVHVAFLAANRGVVHRFHEAALAAGGEDNGPPGLRRIYHEHHYAAYVVDPDGNNIEAVTFAQE